MPDIIKIYSVDNNVKTAALVLNESSVGLDNFSYLKDVVSKELESGITSISFDMKDLSNINSSGLGILISCLKKIKENGGSLKIINANEKIRGVFKLTKLDNVFEI